MERSEHTNLIHQLNGFINPEHVADASEILTRLSEDYETVLTEQETLTNTNNELTERNNRLRDVNGELMLKVGVPKEQAKETKSQTQTNNENKLSYDDLFDEKGSLK